MTTVAVTGSSGYLGRVLLQQLGAHPAISRVVGIDITEPTETTRNLEFYNMDIRSPDLSGVIGGCDVLVHLAFTVDNDPPEIQDVNVGGTRRVLEAAVTAGVGKVVLASCTMAYGAHPDNDFPLSESSPLRPAPDLPHSAHNAEAEDLVRVFASAHPQLETVVLRFCQVFGPTLSGTAARFVETPYAFAVRGYDVPQQAVHESDAGRALLIATLTDLRGVFNVCPDDSVSADRATEILSQRRIELDPLRTGVVAQRVGRLRLGAVVPASVPFLMYPCIASNSKLRATGFAFEHSAADALQAGTEARKGWIALGDVRFRPRRLALAGGAVAAVLLGGAVRSRRARRDSRGSQTRSEIPNPRRRR